MLQPQFIISVVALKMCADT